MTTIHEFLSTLDPNTSAAEIQTAREDLGLSIEEMARFLGASTGDVAQWEADISTCPLPLAVRYSLGYLSLSNQINGDPFFDDLDERIAEAKQMLADSKRRRAELREKLKEYNIEPAT